MTKLVVYYKPIFFSLSANWRSAERVKRTNGPPTTLFSTIQFVELRPSFWASLFPRIFFVEYPWLPGWNETKMSLWVISASSTTLICRLRFSPGWFLQNCTKHLLPDVVRDLKFGYTPGASENGVPPPRYCSSGVGWSAVAAFAKTFGEFNIPSSYLWLPLINNS